MSTDTKLVAVGGATAAIPLDTDSTMAADSDLRVATQKAVAAYVTATGLAALTREVVAATGTDASDGAEITKNITVVTASNGTKAVALPAAAATLYPFLIINSVTTTGATLPVFPINGGNDTINGGASFAVGPGRAAMFVPTSATAWYVEDLAGATSTKAEANILTGVTATAAELNYNDIASLGTGAASKAVVLNAGEDFVWPATGILTYGVLKDPAGTTLGATAAEINAVADISAMAVVALTATAPITAAAHAGKICYITGTDAATYTLPEATGTGHVYTFIIGEVNTNGTVFTTADATNADYRGVAILGDADDNSMKMFAAAATDELITLNGTTTGGAIGDKVVITDIAIDIWQANIIGWVPAGSNPATPFSGV